MSGVTGRVSLVQTLEGCTAGKQGSGCKPDRGASLPSGGAPAKLLYTTPQRQTFVGEAATPAGNYFTRDFRWEDLKDELASKGLLPDLTQEGGSGTDRELHVDGLVEPYDRDSWERFHRKDNATARFYKERRYLLLEFPCLTVTHPPQHFVELGCGCGSSLLPVLKANPTCRVTGTDLSPTAVDMFKAAAGRAGIQADRVSAFPLDATDTSNHSLAGACADAVLLIFTLAALHPAEMPHMLRTAFQALRPGGRLLVRDHGLYDLTQLRLPPQQRLAQNLYRRLDGTLCYFFSLDDLVQTVEGSGFEVEEADYVCVRLLNRQKKLEMKRVFVHGVFKRP